VAAGSRRGEPNGFVSLSYWTRQRCAGRGTSRWTWPMGFAAFSHATSRSRAISLRQKSRTRVAGARGAAVDYREQVLARAVRCSNSLRPCARVSVQLLQPRRECASSSHPPCWTQTAQSDPEVDILGIGVNRRILRNLDCPLWSAPQAKANITIARPADRCRTRSGHSWQNQLSTIHWAARSAALFGRRKSL
jgi:hypothetical protein